jgi:hypothetical protein
MSSLLNKMSSMVLGEKGGETAKARGTPGGKGASQANEEEEEEEEEEKEERVVATAVGDLHLSTVNGDEKKASGVEMRLVDFGDYEYELQILSTAGRPLLKQPLSNSMQAIFPIIVTF